MTSFLASLGVVLVMMAATVLTNLCIMPSVHSMIARLRARRAAGPLPEGYRWLTTRDVWQKGDEYNGGSRWFKIGSPDTSCAPGQSVHAHTMCYTPRGPKKRQFKTYLASEAHR